jgi:hypothetical protein
MAASDAIEAAVAELLAAGDAAAEAPRYSLDDYRGKPAAEWPSVTVPVPVYAVLWDAASDRDLADLLTFAPPQTATLAEYSPGRLVPGEPLCPYGVPRWWDKAWIGASAALAAALALRWVLR